MEYLAFLSSFFLALILEVTHSSDGFYYSKYNKQLSFMSIPDSRLNAFKC